MSSLNPADRRAASDADAVDQANQKLIKDSQLDPYFPYAVIAFPFDSYNLGTEMPSEEITVTPVWAKILNS